MSDGHRIASYGTKMQAVVKCFETVGCVPGRASSAQNHNSLVLSVDWDHG